MSEVNKQSTLMVVRITEPMEMQRGCRPDDIANRVARKAARMFADKLIDEKQVTISSLGHTFFGHHDVTYEVELALIPVAEHRKHLDMATAALRETQLKLATAEQTIAKQADKISKIKAAVEAKL